MWRRSKIRHQTAQKDGCDVSSGHTYLLVLSLFICQHSLEYQHSINTYGYMRIDVCRIRAFSLAQQNVSMHVTICMEHVLDQSNWVVGRAH